MPAWKKSGRYFREMDRKIYDWIWDQRIPVEEYVTFAGRGGVGKGALLIQIATSVIHATALPDEDPRVVATREPGLVLWLGPEDSMDHVLSWRLDAAGLTPERDGGRLLAQKWTAKLDKGGMQELEEMINGFRQDACEEYGPQEQESRMLVVADPIGAYFGGSPNENQAVQEFINSLQDFIRGRNITIIGVRHYSKGGNGKDARDGIMGAQTWVNAPRMTLIAGKVGDTDARAVIQKKSNIIPEEAIKAVEYSLNVDRTKDRMVQHTEVFEWKGIMPGITEDHLMVMKEAKKIVMDITNSSALQTSLTEILSPKGTKVLRTQIDQLVKEDGFREASSETIRRALVAIGAVNDRKGGDRKVQWWIPPTETKENEQSGRDNSTKEQDKSKAA